MPWDNTIVACNLKGEEGAGECQHPNIFMVNNIVQVWIKKENNFQLTDL